MAIHLELRAPQRATKQSTEPFDDAQGREPLERLDRHACLPRAPDESVRERTAYNRSEVRSIGPPEKDIFRTNHP